MGNGLLYRVPRFQRDYSWTEVEWDDLWRDIQDVLEGEDEHYMGYLVLQSKDSKVFDVIDGQQRLTTLSVLILAILRNLQRLVEQQIDAESNKVREEQLRASFIGYLDPETLIARSKLTLNRTNDPLYQRYLVPLLEAPKRNLTATAHLLRKAFLWYDNVILRQYGPAKSGAELARVVGALADRLVFTVIWVSDELNAFKVFETLNARGVKLSSTDLLKNYLFSVVHGNQSGDEQEINELDARWEALVAKLGSESFPHFLRAHWISRYRFVRHAALFKVIRGTITSPADVFKLLREVEEDADIYAALSNAADTLWVHPQQRQAIAELKLFGVSQVYPLLLAAYRCLPGPELTDLLRAISAMSFRYNVISNLPANEQEILYTSVAERISRGELQNFNSIVRELRAVYPRDEKFRLDFADKVLKTTRNKRIVRYLLAKLECHLSGTDLDFDSETFSIEHVLPEHPKDGWEQFTDQQAEMMVYRLGNMTLLKTSENRDLGNRPFAEKRAVYQSSQYTMTKRIAEHNSEWNPDRIIVHQRWLADQATSIWKVSQLT